MKQLTYTVNIEPAEEGGYVVTIPALNGTVTQGETYEEALAMAKDAIRCYVESLIHDGEPIPTEAPPETAQQVSLEVSIPAAVESAANFNGTRSTQSTQTSRFC